MAGDSWLLRQFAAAARLREPPSRGAPRCRAFAEPAISSPQKVASIAAGQTLR